MARLLCLFLLFASLAASAPARATGTLGAVAAELPYSASRIVADPARAQVYLAVPASNSVLVFSTVTLQVIATIGVGSNPVDMAVSMDGNTLYVANKGTTLSAISVLDLPTLTVRATYSLPGSPVAIAAGLAGRVYVSVTNDNFQYTIYQLDGPTGTVQTTFNANYYDNNLLQITPNGTTLFAANLGSDPGTLKSFDVSTATPTALQSLSNASENANQLVVSQTGKYVCLPSGGGNPGSTSGYSTLLFSTADITSYYGALVNGAYPGPLAFSPDDSLVYQTQTGDNVLQVFSTATFAKLNQVSLPSIAYSDYDEIHTVAIDNTGSYLFVAKNSFFSSDQSGQVLVLTTGAGTLTPPSLLPAITSKLSADLTVNVPSAYQITASNNPTSFKATNLPDGLSVNTATGLISGVPTGTGFASVQISATNASGTATATLDLEVSYSYLPVFTTTSLAGAVVGQPYSFTVSATNYPYSYSATGLPPGLSIDSDSGTISGVATVSGTYSVVLSTINYVGAGTTTLPLTVAPPPFSPPVITSGSVANGLLGSPFAYQITATNAPTAFGASGLPAGLNLDPASGLISGTPSATGTFSVPLSATNASGTGVATLTLSVTANFPTPVITSLNSATAAVGSSFTYQIAATNMPTTFGASGLPAGLTLNTSTGVLSGTPSAAGTFTIPLSATNASGTGVATLMLSVASIPAPVITSLNSSSTTAGQPYSYQISAINSPTGYGASGLPSGLSVNTTTGLISGTPTVSGTFSVTISATNATGPGVASLVLKIDSGLPTVDLVAVVSQVTAGSGDVATVTVTRTGDLADKLVVDYFVSGSAQSGTDYAALSGKVKIKPGRNSATIEIVPGNIPAGTPARKLKLTLLSSDSYQLGDLQKAKVKILPGE